LLIGLGLLLILLFIGLQNTVQKVKRVKETSQQYEEKEKAKKQTQLPLASDETRWEKAALAPWERLAPAPRLDSLSEAPDGTVWGLSSSALYAFSGEPIPQKWTAQALTGGYASLKWLEAGIPGEVWFGTYNSQLYRFAKDATEAFDKPDSADLTAIGHWQNQLLAAYGKRLYIWNTRLGLFQVLKEFPEEVTALHSQTSAELWVGAKKPPVSL
jgi:hypothetical protein